MVYACAIIQYYGVYVLKYRDFTIYDVMMSVRVIKIGMKFRMIGTFAIEMTCKKCPNHPEFSQVTVLYRILSGFASHLIC